MDEDVQGKKIKLKKTKGGAQQYVRGDDLPERLKTINEMDDSYLPGKESEKRSRLTKAFLAEMDSENYAEGGLATQPTSRERLTELLRKTAEQKAQFAARQKPSVDEMRKMFMARFGGAKNLPDFPGPPARPGAEEFRKQLEERFKARFGGAASPDEAAAEASSKRLNIAPATPGRIAGPVSPVPTSSPAYKKGGLVKSPSKSSSPRGCGLAAKGHGKTRMF